MNSDIDYFSKEYYLSLFYDKKKEKRIRECKNEDLKIHYGVWQGDASISINQSSQLCDWGNWNKQLGWNMTDLHLHPDFADWIDTSHCGGWETPNLGKLAFNDSDGNQYYPYIHITIDPSCANYFPTVLTENWFDFFLQYPYHYAEDDLIDFVIYPLPVECKYFTGLEYLNSPVQTSYALLSPDKTTLTFYCDYKQQARAEEGTTYSLNTNSTSPGWLSEKENITKVVFDPSFADARPVTTRYWFNGMSNLNTIEGLKYLNTSEVTSMYCMFYGCSSLTSLDLSTFDTSKTTSMSGMFNNCTSLKNVNLSKFNTTSMNSMRLMFQNCTSLESVDISSFDTSSVTDMRNLFYGCTDLTSLDLSTLEIADGAQTGNLLYNCKGLKSLRISPTFGKINSNACTGVGTTAAPCRVYAPEGFDFGVDTSGGYFKWKGGFFRLNDSPAVTVASVSARIGEKCSISVNLSDADEDKYNGYQFDLVLPEDIRLVGRSNGFRYTLSERFKGDGVSCAINEQADGSYRVVCYSTNHKTISGTEGALITMELNLDDVLPGTYTGQIRRFTLNDSDNNSVYLDDTSFTVTVQNAAKGDVNHDGSVDISDVLATVDYVLGRRPVSFFKDDADINGDDEINISDVLCIVDIILGYRTYNAPANARLSTLDNLSLMRKDNTYTLCLDNHEPYAGFQMLLSLPEGCTLRDARLVSDRSDGHRLGVRDHGDGTYTLIAYSPDGRQLRDNGTPLLRLTVSDTHSSEDIQMSGVLFSTPLWETVVLPDVNGMITSIMDFATDKNYTAPAYNMQGQRVSSNYRGIIIKNGEKRLVKSIR